MQPAVPAGVSSWFLVHRLALTTVLFAAFFWIYFQRMSLAVVAAQLDASFGLSAAALGLLGSAYFYPYAVMQLPLGVLVDAVGARLILTLFVSAAGLGSVLFAVAGGFEQALAGRVLVGFGSAAVWLASQRLFVEWYRPRQFATINGLMNTVGNLGGLTGSLPLAIAAGLWGWRAVFAGVGVIMLAMALLCLSIVRERPNRIESGWGPNRDPRPSIKDSLRSIVSRRDLWLVALALLPFMGTRFGFQSLWGGPYLADVQRLNEEQVGSLLMAMSIAIAVAGPLVGYLSDHVFASRRRLSLVGFSLYTLC